MNIGLAQINTTVGDMPGNLQKVVDAYHNLAAEGADLILYPELVLCGYPPRDLLLKGRFVEDIETSLQSFALQTGTVPALVGFVERNINTKGRSYFNSVALCCEGKWEVVARKCLLPTYDVFDEARYFEPADSPGVIELGGSRIGVTICEDIWNQPNVSGLQRYSSDPVQYLSRQNLDLLVNLSASPWHVGKEFDRIELLRKAANACNCTVAYCNAVGGNDELIFDGNSVILNSEGVILFKCTGFAEDIKLATSKSDFSNKLQEDNLENIRRALVLGLRDYADKSGFRKALLGLSGGIDSALTAAIAAEALGAENVTGVSLPSKISSQHSKDDAHELACNLGIEYHVLGISEVVAAAQFTLAKPFEGLEPDVTEENLQARARGLLLMALSNKHGALLLTTGNKSELAVGYCTLYGDMCGGLAVISDLPKCLVFDLARHYNREREVIPLNTIEKPPSAELRPDQKDEDSLPPYPILDEILERYVEKGQSSQEIIEAGFEAAIVCDIIRKVDLNEYKRKQAAPGLKITPLAFGIGRRMPIVQKFQSQSS